jgi:hypothetical protein
VKNNIEEQIKEYSINNKEMIIKGIYMNIKIKEWLPILYIKDHPIKYYQDKNNFNEDWKKLMRIIHA